MKLPTQRNSQLKLIPSEYQFEFEKYLVETYCSLLEKNDYAVWINRKSHLTLADLYDQIVHKSVLRKRYFPQIENVRRYDEEVALNIVFCQDLETILSKYHLFYIEESDYRLGYWEGPYREYKNLPITQVW